jgi:hypothetical protein
VTKTPASLYNVITLRTNLTVFCRTNIMAEISTNNIFILKFHNFKNFMVTCGHTFLATLHKIHKVTSKNNLNNPVFIQKVYQYQLKKLKKVFSIGSAQRASKTMNYLHSEISLMRSHR